MSSGTDWSGTSSGRTTRTEGAWTRPHVAERTGRGAHSTNMGSLMPDHSQTDAASLVDAVVEKYADELIDLRRDLHAHPELSWTESRTTDRIFEHLDGTGWTLTRLDGGGVIAEIGEEIGRAHV